MEVWYADSSAVVKLITPEPETSALRDWLADRDWVVSDLHRTELHRVAQRIGGTAPARVRRLIDELDVVRLTPARFDEAGRLEPAGLRSLDALHLAAARALGEDLAGLVAYDLRLADAARGIGIAVASPS